jgi:hypothetical protein
MGASRDQAANACLVPGSLNAAAIKTRGFQDAGSTSTHVLA